MSKFTPTKFKDKVADYPKRYALTLISGTIYEIDGTGVQGTITEPGTSLNATAFNNIEDGISRANNAGYSKDNLLSDEFSLCQSVANWLSITSSDTVDNVEQKYGTGCIKVTLSSASGGSYRSVFNKLDLSKYYLFSLYVKKGTLSGSGVRFRIATSGGDYDSSYSTSETWERIGMVLSPTQLNGISTANFYVNGDGSSSEIFYFDGCEIREITAKEYAEGVTTLLARYPFAYSKGIPTKAEIVSLGSEIYDGQLEMFIEGRTVVNLLSDDVAGCESTSGWTTSSCSVVTDNSNELEGTNCIKITLSSTLGLIYRDVLSLLDTSKYYLISANLKNGDATNLYLEANCVGDAGAIASSVVTSTSYIRKGVVIKPSDFDGASEVRLRIIVSGTSSQYGFVDAIQINEISAYEYSLGADAIMPYYPFHRGMKSVECGRGKSVGKNLFDINRLTTDDTNIEVRYINDREFTLKGIASGGIGTSEIYPFNWKYNTRYTLSFRAFEDDDSKNTRFRIVYTDGTTDDLTAPTTTETDYQFGTDASKTISKLSYTYSNSGGTTTIKNLQIEEGIVKTFYEPYKSSQAYIPQVLRATNVADSYEPKTGKVVKRCDEYVLQSGDIDSVTTGTNVQYCTIGLNAFSNIVTQASTTIDGSLIINGFPVEIGNASIDGVGNEYHFRTTATDLYLAVPLGTWADVAAARTALTSTVTTKIVYELDPDSYETTYYPPSAVNAWVDGTLFNEVSTEDTATYHSGLTVSNTDLPISTLDYVIKIDDDTNTETPIDISTATFSSGDTSFTLSGASDGERYRFAYYPLFGSTRAEVNYSYPTSTKGQINGLSEQVVELDKKVDFVNNKLDDSAWELISEYVVEGSADAQIDFEDISTVYAELRMFITGVASTTTTQQLYMQFNSDTGGNYDYAIYNQAGTSANTDVGGTATKIVVGDDLLKTSAITGLGFAELIINNSNATHYKHVLINQAEPTASINMRKHGAGLWRNTSTKITSITFTAETDSIGVDSRFVLFGRRITT